MTGVRRDNSPFLVDVNLRILNANDGETVRKWPCGVEVLEDRGSRSVNVKTLVGAHCGETIGKIPSLPKSRGYDHLSVTVNVTHADARFDRHARQAFRKVACEVVAIGNFEHSRFVYETLRGVHDLIADHPC